MIHIIIPTTKERRPRLKVLLDSIDEHTENVDHVTMVFENELGGWVPAVHAAINGLKDDSLVMLLGSDIEVQKDWLSILSEAFLKNEVEDLVAEPFNPFYDPPLCQHPLARVKTIKKYLYKGYIHNFSDNEMTERLTAEGKFLYVPEARILHHHWTNKEAPYDKTYRTIMSSYEIDRELYERRKINGFMPQNEI